MIRESGNEYTTAGYVLHGFDYSLQVWVEDGVVLPCGHPRALPLAEPYCCNGARYAGTRVADIPGAENFLTWEVTP
jgi:hypothetical protein